MIKADLHLHSTASDGVYAPGEVAARAARLGFTHIALSDHDSVKGIPEASEAAKHLGIRLIPAVELSCGSGSEIHVLGYGFNPQDSTLADFFADRVAQRIRRAEEMVERLCEIGKTISMARVRELAGGVIARPHIARALVEAGHASSVPDAFTRFLSPGKPGYVPKARLSVAEAVVLVGRAGGLAVLAHPMEMKKGEMAIEALVHEWHGQGLAGVEVYHPSAQNNHAAFLYDLARREGMLVTGGSDFHGETVRRTEIGDGLDRWRTMDSDMQALLAAIDE